MKTGYLSLAQSQELIGVSAKVLRRTLWACHKKHGDVLFRFSGGKNSKLWTTPAALRKAFPERISEEIPELDVLELRALAMNFERRLNHIERKVGTK